MASYFLTKPDMRENTYQAAVGKRLIYSAQPFPLLCLSHLAGTCVRVQFMSSVRLEGIDLSQQTSTKVSAQTRERTLRIAVVPFSSRPTLHWSTQHSASEQDYKNREKGVETMSIKCSHNLIADKTNTRDGLITAPLMLQVK